MQHTPTVETDMTGLILLAIAVAIISAVTLDLIRPHRDDARRAVIAAHDEERRRRAQRYV
jgi:hypothetical protein